MKLMLNVFCGGLESRSHNAVTVNKTSKICTACKKKKKNKTEKNAQWKGYDMV